MQEISSSDNKSVDWGNTSIDYAAHRPGPPDSFYQRLISLGIGLSGQSALDLGTGTGVIARQLARQGCDVSAADISPEQIHMAKELADAEQLSIDFTTDAAEDLIYSNDSFDVITANQCFLYFDSEIVAPLIAKWLKPNGVFVISHFSWMPRLDAIARASEELILRHNPGWSASGYDGFTAPAYPGVLAHLHYSGYFYYDQAIPFTRENWLGRIRASRGVGASMDEAQVSAFNDEHDAMLRGIAGAEFNVVHRIDAHILRSGDSRTSAAFYQPNAFAS